MPPRWRVVDPSNVGRLRHLRDGMREGAAVAALNRSSLEDEFTDDELKALAEGHDPEQPPGWEP